MAKLTLVIDPVLELAWLRKKATSFFTMHRFTNLVRTTIAVSTSVALVTVPYPVIAATTPFQATEVVISCEGDEQNSTITVNFSSNTRPRHTISQGDIVIEFPGTFKPNVNLEGKSCSQPVKAIRTGFSKLFIRIEEDRSVTLTSEPTVLKIAAVGATEEPRAALAEAQARVLFELGEKKDALEILERELSQDPANSLLLSARGSYEARLGDNHKALRTLSKLIENEGAEVDYGLYHELHDPYTRAVGASFESIDGGSAFEEQIYTIWGQAPVSQDVVSGVVFGSAEVNHSSIENLRSPQGDVVKSSRTQERYTFEYRHPLEQDDIVFGLKGNEDNLGAHFRFDLRDEAAGTFFRAQLNEPTWEYASSIAFDGTKSSVGVGHQRRILPRLRLGGEVAQNFFTLDSASDAAKSFSANANVGWILATEPASFELVYALDADYFYDIERRSNDEGERYKVFAIQSNEFHSLTINAVKPIQPADKKNKATELYAVAGVAMDRLGDSAPLVGAGVRGGQASGLSGQVEIGRTFTTVGPSDTQTRVLASAVWRF